MKKLSLIILGIILGAVLTYLFCPRQIEEEAVSKTSEARIKKPEGVVSVEQAKALNDNWTKYRQAAVDSAAQQQGRDKDDRAAWWSLEDIENYIDYAKKEAAKTGYDMTGIRIYLGVYGESYGEEKKNLTTMFLVPTGEKSQSKASFSPFTLRRGNSDLTVPPLNNGSGSDSGYPN